ncbi:MAG: CBS domain-containing protein [Methylococcales bacterium]|jgi:CBS domain-containing protein|nr:CBS domain-containing protein [Methylococcales bacterium]MBT7445482.1 CBS domain-containing protein [Methylococcales bacterium]
MKAKDLMDPNPTTLHPSDTIGKAVECIMDKRYRQIPVVDDEGCFQGVFGVNCLLRMVLPKAVMMDKGLVNVQFINESTSDLHRRLEEHLNDPISKCMHFDKMQLSPDTLLVETLLKIYDTKSSIPVVDPDTQKLLGMVSYWDAGKCILKAEV